jgi:benzoyl-CoA reductase/2-hydroxyglutaryl-CoA dehydratase subunit BcrC/BadD/HgdB
MGSKADDLLAEKYGTPIYYIDGSMDSAWGEYPDYDPARVAFLGTQLNQLFDRVQEVIGVEVNADAWDKADAFISEYYSRLALITEMVKADPVPVSATVSELATILPAACTGRGIPEASKALEILIREIHERVEKGEGVVEKGAPRVMFLVGNFSDPSITRMIEGAGLALPVSFFTAPTPGIKPKVVYESMGERMADSEMRQGLYHSSYGLLKRTEAAVQTTEVDGLIANYLFNCRPLALLSHTLKDWVERQVGLPTLALENDIYDTRSYSPASMMTRIETFAETLKARKQAGATYSDLRVHLR